MTVLREDSERSRFILRYVGPGEAPEADVARIRDLPGLSVLDASSGRMLLVDAPVVALRRMMTGLPGWELAPERFVPVPDTRRRVRRSPA